MSTWRSICKRVNTIREREGVCMGEMQMSEMARLIEALRSAGWSEKKINDFLIYIETGKEEYRPGVD